MNLIDNFTKIDNGSISSHHSNGEVNYGLYATFTRFGETQKSLIMLIRRYDIFDDSILHIVKRFFADKDTEVKFTIVKIIDIKSTFDSKEIFEYILK